MSDWHKISIKDVSETITSGGTPSRKIMSHFIGDIPWAKSGEVNGWYIYDTEEHINPEAMRRSSAKLFQRDTVLIAMYGQGETIGKVGILGVQASSNQALCAITTNPTKCDPRFLLYLLQVKREEIILLAQGAARRNLNVGKIANFKIDLPDIETQKRISDTISGYNFLIENNKKRIDILEEIAQRLYTEWFVKFKFPGHENEKLVDSGTELGEIPAGWKIKELHELIDIKKGKNITRKTVKKGSVPVVAGGLDPAYFHNTANTLAPVITISASGANAGFVNIYYQDIWASDCSYIDHNATSFIYYYYLVLKNKQHEINNLQKGAAQPHVYPKDLQKLKNIAAPSEILEAFHRIVGNYYEEVRLLKKRNETCSTLRDLLIENLVTGKRMLKQNGKTN